ncbi:MAG TPA: hypothetical protein ENH82_14670 [bacterium]|nr:hypothetical protein [bacterium]
MQKDRFFFYSAFLIIEPVPSSVLQTPQQNVPQIMSQVPINGVYRSKTGYFEPDDLNIAIQIPPEHIATLSLIDFK